MDLDVPRSVPGATFVSRRMLDTSVASELTLPSEAHRRTLRRVEQFARSDVALILLEGETGTGKTQLARYYHDVSSRARGPFAQLGLGAIPDSMAASELFGHVRGAFTDARERRAGMFLSAAGGTLFLDEIGKASLLVQRHLLDCVESRRIRPLGSERDLTVDVRIIAASNVCLRTLVENGSFLDDLDARFGPFRITLPPLRERRADIPPLVEWYVAKHASGCGYALAPTIAAELMAALTVAPWPQNLRGLDTAVHYLLAVADHASTLTMDLCDGPLRYLRDAPNVREEAISTSAAKQAIAAAGSVSGAAKLLGCHRSTVYRARRNAALLHDG
jgi:DNA-binding NtrC family response regulator